MEMEMEDQHYGMADLTHFMLPNIIPQHHHYDTMMVPTQNINLLDHGSAHGPVCATTTASSGGTFSGIDTSNASVTGRWPRHETLALLEIRSRLDSKFKEAAHQKGHLWDEISRIMSEEHGYERSGKKCREKFENMYKYYKKTKAGKSGRHNGTHYRFFLQLEALYCSENSSVNQANLPTKTPICNNPGGLISDSISNSSPNVPSSSDEVSVKKSNKKSKGGSRRNDKRKVNNIRDFVDVQMRKIMEKQQVWLDRMMRCIEHKEQERFFREEKWRRQEVDRIEKEYKFWAGERSWIEARDTALIEALNKFKYKETNKDELANDTRSCYYENNTDQGPSLHNQGPEKLNLLQPTNQNTESSSHSNSNVGNVNTMQEGCFRLLMGEGEQFNLWENHGVKLNNQRGN